MTITAATKKTRLQQVAKMEVLGSSSFSSNIASSSSSSSFNPWMDSRIWSRLPHRLLDRILAFLPPPAFFRSRCVCKRWYSLLFSDSFLEMHLAVSPPLHWFLFFANSTPIPPTLYNSNTTTSAPTSQQPQQAFFLDPAHSTWYRCSFHLLPPDFSPVSSSGGLVAWITDQRGEKLLILYNPLSRAVAQLPTTQHPRICPSVGLAVGHSSLEVVVAGDDCFSPYAVRNLTAECFHADAEVFFPAWVTNFPLPRLCSLDSGRMVFVGGRYYCMNYSPFNVIFYDPRTNEWQEIQAPMKRFLRSPSLVECRGRLLLVAAVAKSKLNVPKSVRLWALQACRQTWTEVGRMPRELYEQFAAVEDGRGFDCVGSGDFVAFTIRGADEVLLFDFYRQYWNWVPPCPYMAGSSGGRGRGRGWRAFAYEPRLATPALGLLDP
ncbi:hypothetical protein ACLOJK_021863 [Asimina triloba]